MSETHPNLMASNVVVSLPEDPALAAIAEHGRERFLEVVAQHPTSSLVWALLAETCLAEEGLGNSSPPTPTPAPATTAGWTRCAATAGRAQAKCRGSTNPTAASCGRCGR